MTPNPPVPPPIPVGQPAVPARKTSTPVVIFVIAGLLLAAIAGTGIVAAILIPTVAKVRETARRTVDSSNLRQIVHASLIYASNGDRGLPPVHLSNTDAPDSAQPATIRDVMAALSREGGLSDESVWHSQSDEAGASAVSFDYVTGLTIDMPPSTPVAWTRGLREDGTWDRQAGVYGADGGHIAFLGGNVTFFTTLGSAGWTTPDGKPTASVLDTLPPSARVVGAGPGTLDGRVGRAPPMRGH